MEEIDGGCSLSDCIFQTMKKYGKAETLENCLKILNIFIRTKMQRSLGGIDESFISECFMVLRGFISRNDNIISDEEIKINYSDIYSFLTNAIMQWKDAEKVLREILLMIQKLLSLKYDHDEIEEKQSLFELLDFLLRTCCEDSNSEIQRPLCFEIMASLFPGAFADHVSGYLKDYVNQNLYTNLPKIYTFLLSIFNRISVEDWKFWNELILQYFLEVSSKSRKMLIDYSDFYLSDMANFSNMRMMNQEPFASNLLANDHKETRNKELGSNRIVRLFIVLFNLQSFNDELFSTFYELYMEDLADEELEKISNDLIKLILRTHNIVCKKLYEIVFDDFLKFKGKADNFPRLEILQTCIETGYIDDKSMCLTLKFVLNLKTASESLESLIKLLCINLGIEKISNNLKEVISLDFFKNNLKFFYCLIDKRVIRTLNDLALSLGVLVNNKLTMEEIPPFFEAVYWEFFSEFLDSKDNILAYHMEIKNLLDVESIATKSIVNALNRYLVKSNSDEDGSMEFSLVLNDFLVSILPLIIEGPKENASYFDLYENVLNRVNDSTRFEAFDHLCSLLQGYHDHQMSFSKSEDSLFLILRLLKLSCKFVQFDKNKKLLELLKPFINVKNSKLSRTVYDIFYLIWSLAPSDERHNNAFPIQILGDSAFLSEDSRKSRLLQLRNLFFRGSVDKKVLELALPDLVVCMFDSGRFCKDTSEKILNKLFADETLTIHQKFDIFLVGILSLNSEYICATVKLLAFFVESGKLDQMRLEIYYIILANCILSKNARMVKNALKILRDMMENKSSSGISQKRINELKVKCRSNFKTWNTKTKKIFLSIFNKK